MKLLARCLLLLALFAAIEPLTFGQEQIAPVVVKSDRHVDAYTLPPDKLAKAEALHTIRTWLYFIGIAWSIAVLILFIKARIAPRVRNFAESKARRRFVQAWLFAPPLLLLLDALDLPFAVYSQNLRRAYGLSVQGWGSWFWDWTKGELITLVLGTFAIWLFYLVVRKSPQRWWLYFWLLSLPLIVLLIFVTPVVIDPLFNHFEPLEVKQPQLVPEIERVVKRGGFEIPRNRMFEMRASDKVTTLNAYVTGVGASKRVVVWDNTAREMTTPQALFVFGHEQGHYILHHMWKGIAFFAVLFLVLLYLGYRAINWMVTHCGQKWDVRGVGDWASFPLLLLLFSLFGFFVQPMASGFSRWMEHDADIYGLEVTHGINADSSQAAAQAFQALGEKGLVYPNPSDLEIFWAYGHPANRDRVQFALQYRPWDEGKPTKFVKP